MKKILSMLMVLFAGILFVPNVYADTTITLGNANDATGSNGDPIDKASYSAVTPTGSNDNLTFTFDVLGLKVLNGDAAQKRPEGHAWIGIKVTEPTGGTDSNWTAKRGLVGGTKRDWTKATDGWFFWDRINPDKLKAAIEGNGEIVDVYEIDWKNDAGETATQKITIVVDANKVTLEDSTIATNPTVWSPSMAKAYKAQLDADKNNQKNENKNENKVASNENKSENEAKKDDVPKTGDTLPIALFGMMFISSLSGIYTFKKVKE